MTSMPPFGRRFVLGSILAAGAAALLPRTGRAQPNRPMTRKVPVSGEDLPVVGLGSWITFNVGKDPRGRDACAEVMREFFAAGGRMIDSSPMYGSAQEVIGHGLKTVGGAPALFSATKVWTSSGAAGPGQIEESRRLWGVPKFDLLQVHNVLAWEKHLETLFRMKHEGCVRHVGITTSHGMRHADILRIMETQAIDFVQVTYNVVDREVERRILPLAAERRIAVIINRPFRQGELIDEVMRHKLPDWAAEIDCANWAQFLLKFIVAHPAVTCAIPATSRVDHVRENMGALHGRLPDAAMRARMVAYVEGL
ncbi:MAG: aldo/keto reductase [Alphaproteobacteria bacterium]|nr:aldo/keto reductase [Alphaproteobacteria bacterium]